MISCPRCFHSRSSRKCLSLCRPFEDTFENAQWGKAKQMQPMWLCMHWSKCIEDTFDNAQWRKAKQLPPMWLCLFSDLKEHMSFHTGEKPVKCLKCYRCDFKASFKVNWNVTYTDSWDQGKYPKNVFRWYINIWDWILRNFAGKRAVPKLDDSQARELQILNRIGHFVPTWYGKPPTHFEIFSNFWPLPQKKRIILADFGAAYAQKKQLNLFQLI